MNEELYELFARNFPFIVRDKATALEILSHKNNKIIEERNIRNELIGASVINNDTILMLCVDKQYRNRGIGARLLAQSEALVKSSGFSEISAGTGNADTGYLMPGVPTSKRYFDTENEELYDGISASASDFFTKRGYVHSCDCDFFDMRFKLCDFDDRGLNIGDMIDGICYRWAELSDRENVFKCTDNACEEFTRWYSDDGLYGVGGTERVLIAADNDMVVGSLIVSTDHDSKLGSIGCTAVRKEYTGRHIASNLALLGTGHLRDAGMADAYLSYTYTGLDCLYGYAGYKICLYFMKAAKQLSDE